MTNPILYANMDDNHVIEQERKTGRDNSRSGVPIIGKFTLALDWIVPIQLYIIFLVCYFPLLDGLKVNTAWYTDIGAF